MGLIVAIGTAGNADAVLIVAEDFDSMSNGDLSGQSTTIFNLDGSSAGTTAWATGKGGAPASGDIAVSGGVVTLKNDGGLSLDLQASDATLDGSVTLFYGFQLTILDNSTTSDATDGNDLIAAFSQIATGNDRNRVTLGAGTSTGQIKLGAQGIAGADLATQTLHLIVMEDRAGTEDNFLTVNESAYASGDNSNERQNNFFQINIDSNMASFTIDRLAIGTDKTEVENFIAIPEPASLALMGLGGLLMLGRSRRTTV